MNMEVDADPNETARQTVDRDLAQTLGLKKHAQRPKWRMRQRRRINDDQADIFRVRDLKEVTDTISGLGISGIACWALGLPFLPEPSMIVLAFAFSSGVGVVFGDFPARKAARLDPIDALRYE